MGNSPLALPAAMTWVLRWYLVVQLLGLLTFLLLRPSLRRLPDGGWAIAKPLGVLLFGLLSWLATAAGLLRHDRGGAALLLAAALGALATLPREARCARSAPPPTPRGCCA